MLLAEDLKKAVLQAAIQGKLVEQRPEEGNAEQLYKKIQAKKQELISEGKIKKEKPLPEITEDDVPFDIPDSWKWVRFSEISELISGSDLKPERYNEKKRGIPYLTGASNITDDGKIILNRWVEEPNNIAKYDDLLLTCKGTVGKIAVLKEEEVHIARQFMAIRPYLGSYRDYLRLCLINQVSLLNKKSKGVIPGIERRNVLSLLVPLPPIDEGKRIVDKLECIMRKIDAYSEAEQELATLQQSFPNDIRKSILQYAMQGKLTKQLETDGNAKDLLPDLCIDERIKEVEEPFDIPDNWMWLPIGSLGETLGTDSFSDGPFGSNLKTVHYIKEHEVRIIQLSNIGENGWKNKNEKYTSYKHLEEVIPRCEVYPGDFVIAKMMPAGRTIIVPDLGTRITLGSDAMKFVPNHVLNKKYLLYAMHSATFINQVYAKAHGITRVRTTLNGIKSYLLPIPPLEEQKRIVEKLDTLLPIIDELSEAI